MLEDLCSRIQINRSDYENFQYGAQLEVFDPQVTSFEAGSVLFATVGDDLEPYQTIREHLYRMSANFQSQSFIDFGGLKGGAYGVTELVDALEQKDVFCVLIGGDELLPHATLNALRHRQQALNICVVDSHLSYHFNEQEKSTLADYLLAEPTSLLHQLCWLGYQSYFINPAILQEFQKRCFDYLRVGDLRAQLEEAEPFLRATDLLGFNLSAIHHRDSPAASRPNPNGFTALEACQLARYAGMSDRLKAFSICGYQPEADERGLSALLIAQMIWYLVQGRQRPWKECPPQLDKLTRYELQTQLGGQPISFFKSQRSERWWFYINDKKNVVVEDLQPCSYKDYLMMCEGDVSERILNALQRGGG